MTSCVRHKCLYECYIDKKCLYMYTHDIHNVYHVYDVHRYDLGSSAVSKWSVPGKPCGLSVTPGSCNLLVPCNGNPSKLVELRADSGQLVRKITLQSDIKGLLHAVQLTTGQYVVCYGLSDDIHQVCMVDAEGKVTRSYGGGYGSGVGQLDYPCHLAVQCRWRLAVYICSWSAQ